MIDLSPNALTVLEKRYLKKDKSGQVIETAEEMFWRVARAIAEAEGAYDPDADVESVARCWNPSKGVLFAARVATRSAHRLCTWVPVK